MYRSVFQRSVGIIQRQKKMIIKNIYTSPFLQTKEYLPNEEWIDKSPSEKMIKFGVTRCAIEQMGEIVYIEFNAEPGEELNKGDDLVVIESVKSVQALTAPFDCVVSENNNSLEDDMSSINTNAESEDSWLVKFKLE
jgi:glycine cleavage system H protein